MGRGGDEADVAAIQEAIRLGITHIDTAEVYSDGHSEEVIGRAIKDFDRANLFITSKVRARHLRQDDAIASAKASLRRLGLAYLDLYLIHGPNPEIPLKETFRVLDFLFEQGLIRHLGVCNFDQPFLEEAMAATKYKIVNHQIHFNLSARAYAQNGVLDFCEKHQILITACRPLAHGQFAQPGHPLLDSMAAKYGKTPAQIALNWVMAHRNVVTIVKTANLEHLRENLGSLGWQLDQADIQKLTQQFPVGETKYVGIAPDHKPTV